MDDLAFALELADRADTATMERFGALDGRVVGERVDHARRDRPRRLPEPLRERHRPVDLVVAVRGVLRAGDQ